MKDSPKVSNILAVYNSASAEQIRSGLSWYLDAHNWCRISAQPSKKGFESRLKRNAGIVAALSPMNEWENNKNKAAQLISLRGRIVIREDNSNGIGLSANVSKAIAIYNGAEPLDILGGDKVRAFYRTILEPTGDIDPVIDRHAFDIAVGERTNDKRRSALTRKGVYAEFAHAYREAAKVAGIGSAQMQAVTWVAWRNSL